jgi:DNA topoisomerase-3
METAGAADMPDDAERKGLGTPATRAAIIEGLVKSGLIQRGEGKKSKYLFPTEKGVNLIRVLPGSVKSPMLTAEWENRLKQIERGETSASDFITAITAFISDTVKSHSSVPDELKGLFPSNRPPGGSREAVGKCPRCGNGITEAPKGFFCEHKACKFAIFKESKFFTTKRVTLTKDMVVALLTEGRVFVSGLYSEKTAKTYGANIVLEDKGEGYPAFKLDFDKKNK